MLAGGFDQATDIAALPGLPEQGRAGTVGLPEQQDAGWTGACCTADPATVAGFAGVRLGWGVAVQGDGFHRRLKISRAAVRVLSMSASVCAAETKPASKAEGAR